ncbi:MAG: hypothetical protein L6Q38_04330 [Nitrospira sp.]|nr:hypothetical protein [Nitrospira sp.]
MVTLGYELQLLLRWVVSVRAGAGPHSLVPYPILPRPFGPMLLWLSVKLRPLQLVKPKSLRYYGKGHHLVEKPPLVRC